VIERIDEQTWGQFSAKLSSAEAMSVLRELVNYVSDRLRLRIEKVSIWEGSFQKASGKYRAMTAWVSKEEHLPGIKTLIDRISASQ